MTKILLALFLGICTTLNAQEKIAKNILDQLSNSAKSYKNISIEFTFIFNNLSQNIKEIQDGNIIIEGDKFLLKMGTQTIINNGEDQWMHLTDINEVQIIKNDPENQIINPRMLFNIQQEEYKYKYIQAKSENKKRLHVIELFPKKRNEFIKINIEVNAINNQLDKITLFDKNGGTYTYLIKSLESNIHILEEFIFNIQEYPNIEVIDLR